MICVMCPLISDMLCVVNFILSSQKQIANISNIVAIKTTRDKKFNIVLRPVSPAFALELSYKVNDITNAINNYFGGDKVEKITIRK